MMLVAWYPQIRQGHEALVAASGVLFAARGAAVLAAAPWPLRPAWRGLSVAIDALLLAAGATLWVLLGLNPVRSAWLGAKLILLLLYIGLGAIALRGRAAAVRRIGYVAALATFGFMVTVAVAHDPRGFVAWL